MRPRLVALAALAFVSRLPQLLSPNLLVDGDESVLGLMAKHFAAGREVPLFFWGQRYGFSTVEAGLAAAAFKIAGVGPLPLKLAMLALWTVGVLFLFLALARMIGERRAFWTIAVLILTPAWAVWSMKARGGYLTAFTASAALLWILVQPRERDTVSRWLAAGALTAIVWLAHPIWLPGLAPFIAFALASRRRWMPPAIYAATTAAIVVAIKAIPVTSSPTWAGPALGNPSIWGTRVRVAQQIYISLTGSYYLMTPVDPPGPVTPAVAWFWCATIALLAVVQIHRVATRRYSRWSHLLFAAMATTLVANWLLLFARDGRYLLPLSALVVTLAAVEMDRLPRRAVTTITAVLVAAGAVSLVEFRNFAYLWTNAPNSLSESRRMQQVINAVTSRGVTHVFTMNGLLDTQLIFYSDERVIARSTDATERYQPYVDAVTHALADGEPVAVVGYANTSGAPGCWDVPICTGDIEHLVRDPERIFTVDGKYFVYVGADAPLLRRLGFDLPPALR